MSWNLDSHFWTFLGPSNLHPRCKLTCPGPPALLLRPLPTTTLTITTTMRMSTGVELVSFCLSPIKRSRFYVNVFQSGDYAQYPSGQQQQQQFRSQSPYKTQPTAPTVTASAPQQEYRAPPSYAPAPASTEPQYPVDSYDYDTYQVGLKCFFKKDWSNL